MTSEALLDVEERHAFLSDDGRYRYWLTRRWAPTGPLATFVMLNPSIADDVQDDQTVGRCKGFARALGCSGIAIVNLYALVSTDPDGLWLVDDPVGPSNDANIEVAATAAAEDGAPIIAAWGAKAQPERVTAVLALPGMGRLTALSVTKAGHPGHPLYLHSSCTPTPWPA